MSLKEKAADFLKYELIIRKIIKNNSFIILDKNLDIMELSPKNWEHVWAHADCIYIPTNTDLELLKATVDIYPYQYTFHTGWNITDKYFNRFADLDYYRNWDYSEYEDDSLNLERTTKILNKVAELQKQVDELEQRC